MRKLIVIIACMLLLVACNAEKDVERVEETEKEEAVTEEVEDEEVEREEEMEEESTDVPEEKKQDEREKQKEETATKQNESNNDGEEKANEEAHQQLIDMANEIFVAQKKKDFTYLESVRSSGTKIDQKNATFTFNDVTYPHEQPFLTEEELGEIEFRYTHENDDGSVIVGFGIIDYEAESSFTVDYQFVKENGSWKMNDMDLNK